MSIRTTIPRLNKELLRLAGPNILTNITVPLLSTADTALMGRVSALHIGAVGLAGMVFNFLYWNFGFLRSGTAGLSAQAFGADDGSKMVHTLFRALLLGWVIAAGILVLQIPLGKTGFWLMQVQPEQEDLVSTYFYIRIWAAPASFALFVFTGWFLGMQNAIYPLILTIFTSALNIAGNFFFVYSLNMDVDGVAWATVIAQYAGILLAFALFMLTPKYRVRLKDFRMESLRQIDEFKKLLKLNRDLFIRTLFLSGTIAFIYSQSSAEGELILAVNTVLMQYLNWMSFGIDGFAFAAESLVGKYLGAGEEKTTRKVILLTFVWGMVMAAIYASVYGLAGDSLLYVFTDRPEVVAAAQPYLFWMVLVPMLGTPCYLWDGVFIGLTASRSMRDATIVAALTGLAAWLLIGHDLGLHGLWIMMTLFLVGRGAVQTWMYARKGLEMP